MWTATNVFLMVQTAVKKVAHLLSRAGIEDLFGEAEAATGSADRDKAKKLDIVAVCHAAHQCANPIKPHIYSAVDMCP